MTQPNPPLRVAIFASVSTPQQASVDKDSLPSQLRDGRLWAESVNSDVVITFEVPGHSRHYIFYQEAEGDIPTYRALREACEQRVFDVLWCRARDRLGRTDALISQVEALVANAGAEVYSAAMPHTIGNATEAGAIVTASVERATAQLENIQRRKRHMMGMKARVRRGLFPTKVPYGYRPLRDERGRTVGAELVPEETAALELATDLFLQGIGYPSITKTLNENGYPAPASGTWRTSTVQWILHNDAYAGRVSYGSAVCDEPTDVYAPVWDEDVYHAVLRERKRRYRGGKPPASFVSGVAVCKRCGWKMIAQKRRKGKAVYYSYICNRHKERHDCHYNSVPMPSLLAAAQEALTRWKGCQLAEIETMLTAQYADVSDLERKVRDAEQQVARIAAERQRLLDLVLRGTVADDLYRIKDEELQEQLAAAEKRLSDANRLVAAIPNVADRARMIHAYARMHGDLSTLPVEQARHLLLDIGMRIMCESGEIVSVDWKNKDGRSAAE